MKTILWLMLAVGAVLVAGCGSGADEESSEGASDGMAGRAPPVATATAPAPTPTPAVAELADRLDELALDEGDVPAGLSKLGEMNFDYDLKTLGLAGAQGGKAHMTMFAEPDQRNMVVSVVILLDDAATMEQALAQMDNLTADQMESAFDMAGNFGGMRLIDSRDLDVSGLGEHAFGVGLTMELPQVGVSDAQMTFFGRDSLLAMVMTMAMGGGAPADAVSLAKVMDAKITGALD